MGVKMIPAPWWLTWLLLAALATIFLGERVLGETMVPRAFFSLLGGLTVLAVTVWRFLSWRRTGGAGGGVERLLLFSLIGCVVAVVGFVVSSEDGMRWLNIEFATPVAERRFETIAQILSAIVLAVSLLTALGAQWALAAHRHAGAGAAAVESLRVRETSMAGLTVALAGAFLMLSGYVATRRDKSLDFSYFKTASPGSATQQVVENLSDPLRVLLFFPEVNEVKDEVGGYFRRLAAGRPNVVIEEHDPMVAAALAREHRISSDGTILLLRGNRSERITVPTDLAGARSRLRTFDRDVQRLVVQLARNARAVYVTVGHGEINAPGVGDSVGTAGTARRADAVREIMRLLNYRVSDLGLREGLGRAVPDDAAAVLVLGPRRPFLEEELATLVRYLARGGSLMLALDPDSDFDMGPLEGRLGVRFRRQTLMDDRQHLRRVGSVADRQLIITDRFSAHEAVTTLSRTRVGSGIVLVGAGHLEAVDTTGRQPSFVVRALPSTFADLDGDFEFDSNDEVRGGYNVVAAVEVSVDSGPDDVGSIDADSASESSSDRDLTDALGTGRMRALVYADAEMFTDPVLSALALNAALLADGVRWLAGEEAFSGETESEEDVPIVHTQAEDVAWFYSTILGAPLLVLGAGLVTVFRRRRRRTS